MVSDTAVMAAGNRAATNVGTRSGCESLANGCRSTVRQISTLPWSLWRYRIPTQSSLHKTINGADVAQRVGKPEPKFARKRSALAQQTSHCLCASEHTASTFGLYQYCTLGLLYCTTGNEKSARFCYRMKANALSWNEGTLGPPGILWHRPFLLSILC